jgi:hypothetical protein
MGRTSASSFLLNKKKDNLPSASDNAFTPLGVNPDNPSNPFETSVIDA